MRNRLDWTKLAEIQAAGDRELGPRISVAALSGIPRAKYRNRATIRDGYRFASVLEADRYSELKLLRASGEVRYFLRQVPFHLAPGVLYRADFLVSRSTWNVLDCSHLGVDALSGISIEDTKGFLTETARVKLAMVEQLYGVKVRVLKRSDVQRFT